MNVLLAVSLVIIVTALVFISLPAQTKFALAYRLNLWAWWGYLAHGTPMESRSGGGSAIENTAVIRAILPELLIDVNSFLDVPCGDFHWMKLVREAVPSFDSIYLGLDIIPGMVEQNAKRYPHTRFAVMAVEDMKSSHDLVLMRDLLQHVSTPRQRRILEALKQTGSTWLLINYETRCERNAHVARDFAGFAWTPLNLELPPFNFVPSKRYASDGKDKDYGLFHLPSLTIPEF